MANKIKVSIAMSPGLVKQLDRLAKVGGQSRSELIERLVLEGIEQEETFIKATQQPALMQALARAFSQPGVLKQMAATMNEEMSDEQLNLFQQAMGQLEARAASAAPAAPGKKRKP